MTEDDDDQEGPPRRADGTFVGCGNPKGRPRKSRNILTLFNEKRDEKIMLKIDGRPTSMTRQEAFVENLWNKAIACDPRAASMVLAMLRASGQLTPEPGQEIELSEADADVLDKLVSRLANSKKKEPASD